MKTLFIVALLMLNCGTANAFDPEARRDFQRAAEAWSLTYGELANEYARIMWAYECNVLPHNNRGSEINRYMAPKLRANFIAAQAVDVTLYAMASPAVPRPEHLFTFNFQQKWDDIARQGQARVREEGCDYWKQHPDEASALRKRILDASTKN